MPPKAKYKREEIEAVAYSMVRKHGMDVLSARSLAAELGTSTAPIFTAFQNIEEVQHAVIERAKKLYLDYFGEGLAMTPPFKGTGIKYIQFAKDEPELFKLLFMQGDETGEASHFFPANDETTAAVLHVLRENYRFTEERARSLYNHLSIYTHGLAVLYAQRRCVFTMEDVSRMLTEVYTAFTQTTERGDGYGNEKNH